MEMGGAVGVRLLWCNGGGGGGRGAREEEERKEREREREGGRAFVSLPSSA